MNTFKLSLLSAEHPFYQGECVSLVIPSDSGTFGIQAGHSDMIAAIVPGEIRLTTPDGQVATAAVSEGIVKVEHGEVLLLVDTVERPEEIDVNRARRAAEQAREAILQKKSVQEYYAAQARLARAIGRLRTTGIHDIF